MRRFESPRDFIGAVKPALRIRFQTPGKGAVPLRMYGWRWKCVRGRFVRLGRPPSGNQFIQNDTERINI